MATKLSQLSTHATPGGSDLMYTAAGGSSRAVTVSNLARSAAGVYNVRHYGALGDGATDDTAAIQAAVNACQSAGGGVVLFPPGGTYVISPTTQIAYYDGPYVGISVTGNNIKFQMWGATIAAGTVPSQQWVVLFLVSPLATPLLDANSDWARGGGHANSHNVWFEGGRFDLRETRSGGVRFEEHTNGGVEHATFIRGQGSTGNFNAYTYCHHHQRNIIFRDCYYYGGIQTTLAGAHNTGATVLALASVEGIFAGSTLTVGTESKTVASVDSYKQVTLTAGLTADQVDGAACSTPTPDLAIYFDGARGGGAYGCHLVNKFRNNHGVIIFSNMDWRCNADGITIFACHFRGNGTYGIASQGRNHQFVNNVFWRGYDYAIYLRPQGTRYYGDASYLHDHMQGIVISGNVFIDSGGVYIQSPAFDAVQQTLLRNIVISGNSMYCDLASHILVMLDKPTAGTNPPKDITITGNNVHSTTVPNTMVRFGDNGTTGCLITGNNQRGGTFTSFGAGVVAATVYAANTIRNNNTPGGHGYLSPDPTVTASPYTYTNVNDNGQDVFVSGGTVSGITKGGQDLPLTGLIHLEPGESIVVTYSVAPILKRWSL